MAITCTNDLVRISQFYFYKKTVLTAAVTTVKQPYLYCSRTLEGLIIYGLSPRNNDLVQAGNPISYILLKWDAISSRDCIRATTFLEGSVSLPAGEIQIARNCLMYMTSSI